MPSPISLEHSARDGQMHVLLGTYAARSGVCAFLPNATWLMLESAPQPDGALYLLPEFGGKAGVTRGLATGSPELIVEVAASSRSYDLGPKLALYRRAGVSEYVAVIIEQEKIEWRVLASGSYRFLEPDGDRVFRSRVFPGLWIDYDAFLAGNMNRLLATLELGLASRELQAFRNRSAL